MVDMQWFYSVKSGKNAIFAEVSHCQLCHLCFQFVNPGFKMDLTKNLMLTG